MASDRENGCKFCRDPDGVPIFPYYGMAPHDHDLERTGSVIGSTIIRPSCEWPAYFREDPEAPGCGTWLYCPKCGHGEVSDGE